MEYKIIEKSDFDTKFEGNEYNKYISFYKNFDLVNNSYTFFSNFNQEFLEKADVNSIVDIFQRFHSFLGQNQDLIPEIIETIPMDSLHSIMLLFQSQFKEIPNPLQTISFGLLILLTFSKKFSYIFQQYQLYDHIVYLLQNPNLSTLKSVLTIYANLMSNQTVSENHEILNLQLISNLSSFFQTNLNQISDDFELWLKCIFNRVCLCQSLNETNTYEIFSYIWLSFKPFLNLFNENEKYLDILLNIIEYIMANHNISPEQSQENNIQDLIIQFLKSENSEILEKCFYILGYIALNELENPKFDIEDYLLLLPQYIEDENIFSSILWTAQQLIPYYDHLDLSYLMQPILGTNNNFFEIIFSNFNEKMTFMEKSSLNSFLSTLITKCSIEINILIESGIFDFLLKTSYVINENSVYQSVEYLKALHFLKNLFINNALNDLLEAKIQENEIIDFIQNFSENTENDILLESLKIIQEDFQFSFNKYNINY